jgi:hypothetical protein
MYEHSGCRIEKLQLLSKLERAGVLSTLEASGVTLKFIEDNKLLSKAEKAGVIGLVSDRCSVALYSLFLVVLLLGATSFRVIIGSRG